MNKFIIILLCVFYAAKPSIAANFTILKNGDLSVSASLSKDWQEMTKQEVQVLSESMKKAGHTPSEKLLKAFRVVNLPKSNTTPYIMIFSQEGARIKINQIQKMYSWFENNKNLTDSLLNSQSAPLHIKNIEFMPELPAIFFESTQENALQKYSFIGGITFLRNGYLNIVGYAESSIFDKYADDFISATQNLSISPGFKYYPVNVNQNQSHKSFSQWLKTNFKRLTGALILMLVYGVAFLKKEKLA